MRYLCGCGEEFPTKKEYEDHRKKFHPHASCYFPLKENGEKKDVLCSSIMRKGGD